MHTTLLPLLAALATAQVSATVHVTGKVVSDTGAPIEHAIVSIRPDAAADPMNMRRTTTDASGGFALDLPALPTPGAYVADVTAAGFFPLTGQPIRIDGREPEPAPARQREREREPEFHRERGHVPGREPRLGPGPELRLVLSPIRDFAETVNVSPRASPLDLDQNGSQDTLSGAELLDVPFSGSGSVKAGMKTLNGVVSDK
jgi:hypothetical protein